MTSRLPSTFRRIVCNKLGSDFRAVTAIENVALAPMLDSLKSTHVLVRNVWAAVNASDINFTAGRYLPGAPLPLYPGFEAVGEVVSCGDDVDNVSEGSPVAITGYGCFSEYMVVPSATIIPLPAVEPSFIPLMVSGLTASISLEQVGQMGSGETVLVTAAAGATGQFAVQLAKLAGNHVIGTCSSDSKADYLRSLGCDRVINYKKEDFRSVLRSEYPKGVDLVYESVGGEFFEICVDSLAVSGRLIVIGFISGYQDQSGWVKGSKKGETKTEETRKERPTAPLPVKLLAKSASVRGFFLNNFAAQWAPHLKKLGKLVMTGKLQPGLDEAASTKFAGLEAVPDAIDYMYEGKNVGKVVLRIGEDSLEDSSPRSKL